jgi:hypothetical protein
LEGVDHPEFIPDLHRVDDPERIAPERKRDLEHAGLHTLQRLRNIRLSALCSDSQRCEADRLGAFGKPPEVVQCRLDP